MPPRPVATPAEKEDKAMFRKILIATDGSDLAMLAVEKGVELARALGSLVEMVTVTEPYSPLLSDPDAIAGRRVDYESDVAEVAERILAAATAVADKAGVRSWARRVEHARLYQGIVDVAVEEGFDLVVMASHGRSGFSHMVLGSVAEGVLKH